MLLTQNVRGMRLQPYFLIDDDDYAIKYAPLTEVYFAFIKKSKLTGLQICKAFNSFPEAKAFLDKEKKKRADELRKETEGLHVKKFN